MDLLTSSIVTQRCTKCRIEKPLGQFARREGGRRRPSCKACHAAYLQAYYASHPDKKQEYNKHSSQRYTRAHPIRRRLRAIIDNATAKGVPCLLNEAELKALFDDADECPACGVQMIFERGNRLPNSKSIDRVIPAKGYVKGNVAIICERCNKVKHNASAKELRAIADYIDEFLERNGGDLA